MRHFASTDFWFHYRQLPKHIQTLADKNFEILKPHPENPNLRLKKVGVFYSARVGAHYRAIAKDRTEGLVFRLNGSHSCRRCIGFIDG